MKTTVLFRACALGALLLAPLGAQMKVEGAGAPPACDNPARKTDR